MPDGRVQWIDEANSAVHIVLRGREYIAPMSEVESEARHAGVRVHFDIDHRDGVDAAASVRLRTGTRSNRRQRRFGDLTGARQPGAKVKSTSNLLGVDVTTQPYRVAETWAAALADGDVDGAVSLYGAEAVVHTEAGDLKGRPHLRSFIADGLPTDLQVEAVELRGHDEVIEVAWPPATRFGMGTPVGDDAVTLLRVDHGHIVEQWDRVPPRAEDDEPTDDFTVVIDGPISSSDQAYLDKQKHRFVARLATPPLFSRIKVDIVPGPRRDRPVNASATVDLGGHLLRAHIGAPSLTEAVDGLFDRLISQYERIDQGGRSPIGVPADPGAWRHGNRPTARPDYYDRAVDERELVRHKTYASDELTIEEALWDMEILDYDFFLFPELGSGEDCLVDRRADGVALQCVSGADKIDGKDTIEAVGHDLEFIAPPAPTLTVSGAIERLDAGDEPHVFFRASASGRGNVVYRRFDGHYGLITPADDGQ